MPFRKIEPERLSQGVARQIEALVLQGVLRPGERLPAERELAERLGVSRPSLREALADLQQDGLLTSRPGAGIFIAEVLGSAFSPALIRLFSRNDEAVFDYLDFRLDLETLAAERAVAQGSDMDLQLIDAAFRRMESAPARRNPGDEADADADFHMAIFEAGHNVVMLHMMRAMFDLLRAGVFYNRQIMLSQSTTAPALLDQHRAINAALQARDAPAARRAVTAHLGFIRAALTETRRQQRRDSLARQRLENLRR